VHLEGRIEETKTALADTVGSGRIPRLFMIEVECALHSWQAELAWTRQTIAEIRTGILPWPALEQR
jgi:hypothetical protein